MSFSAVVLLRNVAKKSTRVRVSSQRGNEKSSSGKSHGDSSWSSAFEDFLRQDREILEASHTPTDDSPLDEAVEAAEQDEPTDPSEELHFTDDLFSTREEEGTPDSAAEGAGDDDDQPAGDLPSSQGDREGGATPAPAGKIFVLPLFSPQFLLSTLLAFYHVAIFGHLLFQLLLAKGELGLASLRCVISLHLVRSRSRVRWLRLSLQHRREWHCESGKRKVPIHGPIV